MWQKFKNYIHLLQAFCAAVYFRFPSKDLKVVGVTGTDGKSTTVNMIYHILKSANLKVSAISSVGAIINGKTYDTGLHTTTPSSWTIQKCLRQAADSGSRYFVLEATSHGLDQNRLTFMDFKIAVLTNISNEHLDYHKTYENYQRAKLKLFKKVQYSILNNDDVAFDFFKNSADGKILSYSLRKNADFNLKKYPINLKIIGDFNSENALAAISAATTLGVSKKKAISALSNFKGVLGRLDEVNLGQPFGVYVDFAHTANGLKNALLTLRSQIKDKGSRLIAVFGAAGERDKTKRAEMGKVAAQYADITVVTSEDPRSEDPLQICEQIAADLKSKGKKQDRDFYIILDRQKAIDFAVNLAGKNDIVGLFGKGHEKSMTIGKKEYPWDEFKVAKSAILKKLKTK